MKQVLYIGQRIEKTESGADYVNYRNQHILQAVLGDRIRYVGIARETILDNLCFGVNNYVLERIRQELSSRSISLVFISQSLLGRVAKLIRKEFPNLRIVTFFHNIEVCYAEAYLKDRGIRALPFFFCAKYWERICVANSDYLITLNGRDSNLLNKIYGRESDLELPTSFIDQYDVNQSLKNQDEPPIDYLFVGVSFFANVHGVQWFIDSVMPNVKGHLWIVGKGMDQVQFQHLNSRIHILGFVDDLSKFYYRAQLVVSPIFIGAGMKTKTAEALMYGKVIVGTKEAFEGYDRCDSMIECNNAEEYIDVINNLSIDSISKMEGTSRKLFLEKYSISASINRLSNWFSSLNYEL